MTTDDFVAVMVPAHLVTAVYGFIAAQAEAAGAEPVEDAEHEDEWEVRNEREWSEGLLRRNWQESPPTVRAILKHLASRPGELVPIDELARVVYPNDGDRSKLAGVLGAFGRRCWSRYHATTWPFRAEWNYTKGMWHYAMPANIAEMQRPLGDD